MDVALIMFRDDGDHRPFAIAKPVTTIGRREDCDLRIAVGDVSRKHCKLTVDDGGAMRVEDLGSSNGTFVNGTRVQTSAVSAGDVLRVGPVTFVVQVDGEPVTEVAEDRVRALAAPSAAKSAAATPTRKSHAIDGEIDELSILNDSAQDSAIGFNLDDSKS